MRLWVWRGHMTGVQDQVVSWVCPACAQSVQVHEVPAQVARSLGGMKGTASRVLWAVTGGLQGLRGQMGETVSHQGATSFRSMVACP